MGIALAILLSGITALVFWPVTNNGFINYDDPDYIYNNPTLQQGISWHNVVWSFTTHHAGNYHPLTWISLMIDRSLWGNSPAGYHTTNLLFHAISCGLLLLVLRFATGSTWRSALAAAIFALHPLRVESVAWATERKDVLSMFFMVIALGAYVWYARGPGIRKYICVAIALELALLSKSTAVTLPAIFLLLDFWPLGRIRIDQTISDPLKRTIRQLLIEKIPLAVLSVLACLFTMIAQHASGALSGTDKYPVLARLSNAAVSYMIYLRKMILPTDLAIFYPNRQDFSAWIVAGSVLVIGAITALALRHRTRWPWLTVGWLWFAGALVPMIGLVQSGAQSMADRFTYLPMIGIVIAFAWAIPQSAVQSFRGRALVGSVVMTLLIAMSLATRTQIGYWQDSLTLFDHALAVTTDNHVAHNNAGFELMRRGQLAEARTHYLKSIRINPASSIGHNGLGSLLARTGDRAGALREYRTAVQCNPQNHVAQRNLAVQLAGVGKVKEALEHFEAAVTIRPDDPASQSLLAMTLAEQGRLSEAAEHFQAAVEDDPSDVQAQINLGHVLIDLRRPNEAVPVLQHAMALEPNSVEAHFRAGSALAQLGESTEAAREFGTVLKLQPGDRTAQQALQQVLGFPQQRTASVAE